MPSSRFAALAAGAACLLSCWPALAQEPGGRWLNVEFPRDSPVLLVSFSGSTPAHVHGMSMAIDVHASLLLRNTGTKSISGLTLRVEAQDLTPSGRGSVTLPSLNIRPGEVFPVRADLEVLRPFNAPKSDGTMVQVSLDCALFSDMTSYGPDKLGSRRALVVYELQARRDRHYLAALLQQGRFTQIREELNFGLQDFSPQQFGLELLRDPRPVVDHEHAMSIDAVSFPSSPVQAMGGAAHVVRNEVRAPQIDIKNGTQRVVRSLDMGWIVRDERGHDFVAGSTAAAVRLGPVAAERVTESSTLRFSRPKGPPMLIEALMAFVNDVEFGDGSVWIPTRQDIDAATNDPILRRALATSPERERLADIYRKKGLNGLADELKKVNLSPL
jgi:hypothetical protein